MTDDELRAATELHRKRVGTIDYGPSPDQHESRRQDALEAVRAQAERPYPQDGRPPLRRDQELPTVRSWPTTAGPSEWNKVAAPLRAAIKSAIEARRWPVYIFGPVGVGKTCAVACVYRRWPGSALWHETAELLADVVECRTNEKHLVTRVTEMASWQDGQQSILRKIRDSSLIVLNDLGIRKPSEASYEILLRVIDSRVGKPFFVTSNVDPDQLAKMYDDRVASRLLRGSVIHAVGDDRRSETSKFVRVKCSQAKAARTTQ